MAPLFLPFAEGSKFTTVRRVFGLVHRVRLSRLPVPKWDARSTTKPMAPRRHRPF